MTFSSLRFVAKGWVQTLWLEPDVHLTYTHLGWIRPLPGSWMYLLPLVTAAAGLAMALGWRFRIAVAIFLVTFTWTELIDAALYLNHYWFLTLVGVLMFLLPVHHHWSLDARAGRVAVSSSIPAFVVWLLRAQVGAVYLFAGLAKLNPDWLLRGQPLRLWFRDRADLTLIGPLLDTDAVAVIASWSAAAFDLSIVAWLLWRRSRVAAWFALALFHLATGLLFQIGMFPLVMGAMALIFFEPDWPQRFLIHRRQQTMDVAARPPRIRRSVVVALMLLAAVQVLLPLRHFAEPGNVRWNEDGYYLAWRVMLTDKAGFVEFDVTDTATGQTWSVSPHVVLNDWQAGHAATRPDLIHATALLLADELLLENPARQLEIRADSWISMNGRAATRLIAPHINLLAHDRGELPNSAVLPMPS